MLQVLAVTWYRISQLSEVQIRSEIESNQTTLQPIESAHQMGFSIGASPRSDEQIPYKLIS